MKSPKNKLLEAVQKMVEEAIKEAGPLGYLSKTSRPDAKTGWDPKAQEKWTQDKESQMGISKGGVSGVPSAVSGQNQPSQPGKPQQKATQGTQGTAQPSVPPEENNYTDPESREEKDYSFKTNIGGPAAQRKATMSVQPAGQQSNSGQMQGNQSLADVSSMLQGASEDQLSKIMSILKGN